MPPIVAPTLALVLFGRVATGVSRPSPHRFFSAPGVSRRSPPSSSCVSSSKFDSVPRRRERAVVSSVFLRVNVVDIGGGEGVATRAEDVAVVCEDEEGTRIFRTGVENPDVSEPREMSGCVPLESVEFS